MSKFLKEYPLDNNPLAKAIRKVEDCMRKNGVEITSPGEMFVSIKGTDFKAPCATFPRTFEDDKLMLVE